jgi:hypothetical protein
MGMFKVFRNWETKYALTFMGLIVGVICGAFSVYVYLQKTVPHLKMEVISNANVIDVKEDVGTLDVLYNGVNLKDTHQTLALVTLRVSNDGAKAIPPSSDFGATRGGGWGLGGVTSLQPLQTLVIIDVEAVTKALHGRYRGLQIFLGVGPFLSNPGCQDGRKNYERQSESDSG